jgi:hypothetical protein
MKSNEERVKEEVVSHFPESPGPACRIPDHQPDIPRQISLAHPLIHLPIHPELRKRLGAIRNIFNMTKP